ncbi:uncharacterized protein Z519_11944 [Cladophialophora bantiana CBS 173.52]|uniref:CCHC-type domain-containing protein n=1 Tax=Cladophialophora bantiana (strain ATCC 10958 / CBS 173.52 / CDC B-1940 / NIH 8579) TaxID=1442370 RepID=A0A0D2H1Z0_CLAB1|nr:uncharacterized protein Z519_11944 [Cladophialophora bantiana CBS 173.52]KIW87308.1 hypothetical protein Z519_11944 [Cladophialophora bantiana CBS 173.52]
MPDGLDNAFGAGIYGDDMNGGNERKIGACFNCVSGIIAFRSTLTKISQGEEGHSKAECPHPRKFKGECRNCGQEGHMGADCPTRVVKCKNCHQEGHDALNCTNPKFVDNARVADKSENEAWDLLKQASHERDIGDFKEALQILSKAAPHYTYPDLEKEFRKRDFSIYLIAMLKDHGDTWTNVNLQGETGKKYAVSYFTSDKPQRPTLVDKWPVSAEENLARLADAGVPLDRGVDKCNNCNKVGHITKRCLEERIASVQPTVTCYLCGEEGHRVRDCAQERKRGGRACKICETVPTRRSELVVTVATRTTWREIVPLARRELAATVERRIIWRRTVRLVKRELAVTAATKIMWLETAPNPERLPATSAVRKATLLANAPSKVKLVPAHLVTGLTLPAAFAMGKVMVVRAALKLNQPRFLDGLVLGKSTVHMMLVLVGRLLQPLALRLLTGKRLRLASLPGVVRKLLVVLAGKDILMETCGLLLAWGYAT